MQNKITIGSLDSLPVSSSGLDELNQEFANDLQYKEYLEDFRAGKNQELDKFFQEHPHLIDSIQVKALFLLNLLATGQKILSFNISVRGSNTELADDCAYHLTELVKDLDSEIDLYQTKEVLPTIVIYFSDYLLKDKFYRTKDLKVLEQAQKVIFDDALFEGLVDADLIAQKYRLRALYYRRVCHCEELATKQSMQKSEDNIVLYRKHFKPDLSKKINLNKLVPEKSNTEVFDRDVTFLEKLYQEAAELQSEALIRSGVFEDTCFYFQCSDCCKKDFPTVSLTEFLYIKNSLSEEELNKLKAKAEEIQKAHEKKHGFRLGLVDQTKPGKQKENPSNFQFTCPFLDDKDSCTIHDKRPLACRVFGLSTIDGEAVQACKFYLTQYQYNASHRNERDVYDSDPHTKMLGEINKILAKKHDFKDMEQPVGTLVAWLTETT